MNGKRDDRFCVVVMVIAAFVVLCLITALAVWTKTHSREVIRIKTTEGVPVAELAERLLEIELEHPGAKAYTVNYEMQVVLPAKE